MFLGSSVISAIWDAVAAARKERKGAESVPETLAVRSPATPEWIRMACVDQFTDMVRFP